jgi:Ku C terminal domain like
MQQVIRQLVTKSYADNSYDKVIKALEVYRAEAIDVVFLWEAILNVA